MAGYPHPADPWAGRTSEVPIIYRNGGRRPLYGFVYQLNLRNWTQERPPYIGKTKGHTPTAVNTRVHGKSSSAHTSRRSVAENPWKAGILPGRAGWMILERVYATGDDVEDEARLRRAEADWIDRRDPVFNEVRPVRENTPRQSPETRQARAVYRSKTAPRRSRRLNLKPALLLTLSAVFAFLAARVVLAMNLPWPAAPWIVAPVVGLVAGWAVFLRLHKMWRRITK